jgi:hypothetical protein
MVIFYYGTSLCCASIALLCKEQGITVLGVNLVHAFVCEFIAEEIRTSCDVERKENVDILNNDNRIGNNIDFVDVNHEVKARSINCKKMPGTDIYSSALGTGTDSIASNDTQKNHQGQEDNDPLCVRCGIKPASYCLKYLKRLWCASYNEEEGHVGIITVLNLATGSTSAASSEERVACNPVNIENQIVLQKKKVSFIIPSTTHGQKHIDANNARSRRQKESFQRKNNKGEDSMLKPPTEQSHLSAGHVRFRQVFTSSLHSCVKTQGPYVLVGIAIVFFRLNLMRFKQPIFDDIQNPAMHAKSRKTRVLTFSYVAAFHIYLLVCPLQLSVDWNGNSIPLLLDWDDRRNIGTLFSVTSTMNFDNK